jgi:GAF domain-containing protein
MSLTDTRELELLELTQERMRAQMSRDGVIAAVKDSARQICKSDGITFILREGNMCHYVEEDAIGPLWKGQYFPISACISGWSMLNGQTAVIEDIFADPRIPHDAYRPTFVKSLIMTPVGEKNVAAMGAYWKETRRFSDLEILTVKTFSAIVGRALSNLL